MEGLPLSVGSLSSNNSGHRSSAGSLSARETRSAKKKPTKKSTSNKETRKQERPRAESRKKKSKEPASKRTGSKRASAKKSTRRTTSRSNTLAADLKKAKDERYTRAELIQGIELAVRYAGGDAIRQTLLAMVSGWIPGIGEKVETRAIELIRNRVKDEYPKCNEAEQKGLRAVIFWIKNDFDLKSSLAASEFVGGFVGSVASSATPPTGNRSDALNLKPFTTNQG